MPGFLFLWDLNRSFYKIIKDLCSKSPYDMFLIFIEKDRIPSLVPVIILSAGNERKGKILFRSNGNTAVIDIRLPAREKRKGNKKNL